MPANRPRSRQEGYITIIREYIEPGDPDWHKRYVLNKNRNELTWTKEDNSNFNDGSPSKPAEVVWRDIFVTGIDWGKDPKTVDYTPIGLSGDRSEIIGFKPTLSFKSALINRQLWNLMRFRAKYRILIDYKDSEVTQPYDSFEFIGCSPKGWKAGGSDLVEQDITFNVEELPNE